MTKVSTFTYYASVLNKFTYIYFIVMSKGVQFNTRSLFVSKFIYLFSNTPCIISKYTYLCIILIIHLNF